MKMDEDKIHREILEEAIKDSYNSDKPSNFRKCAKIIVTAIIVLSLLTYLIGFRGLEFIEGRLASHTIDKDFTVKVDDNRNVIFDEDVYSALKNLFLENKKAEFKVCLIGEKIGNDYFVSDIYVPVMFNRYVFGHVDFVR